MFPPAFFVSIMLLKENKQCAEAENKQSVEVKSVLEGEVEAL